MYFIIYGWFIIQNLNGEKSKESPIVRFPFLSGLLDRSRGLSFIPCWGLGFLFVPKFTSTLLFLTTQTGHWNVNQELNFEIFISRICRYFSCIAPGTSPLPFTLIQHHTIIIYFEWNLALVLFENWLKLPTIFCLKSTFICPNSDSYFKKIWRDHNGAFQCWWVELSYSQSSTGADN